MLELSLGAEVNCGSFHWGHQNSETLKSKEHMCNKRISGLRWQVFIVLLLHFLAISYRSQTPVEGAKTVESGKYRLYKFQQPIGEEAYQVVSDGEQLVVKADFKFTDRGTDVPLSATLHTDRNFKPNFYTLSGRTSRSSTIDCEVNVVSARAIIREGSETTEAPVPGRYFTIAGYAPTSMQMILMRYLIRNKIRSAIRTFPRGHVSAEYRGLDLVEVAGRRVELKRFVVNGLIWGRQWVWIDRNDNLVALVGIDAEFDHFEALLEGYDDSLNFFVRKAAQDGMEVLSKIGGTARVLHTGSSLAITNANLIDGTGKPPQPDTVVVIENGRIKAVGPRSEVQIPNSAKILNARGKYLLPGLWDMHAHFEQVEWGPVYLAAGVTTVRDVGNEFDFIKAVRDSVDAGKGFGPRLLLAGIVDGDSRTALGIVRANTPNEARAVVKKYHEANFQQIKVYSSIKAEVLRAICDEAHRRGMTVLGHIPSGMTAKAAVEAGLDQISHIRFISNALAPAGYVPQPGSVPAIDVDSYDSRSTLQFFKNSGTVIDPTIALYERSNRPASEPYVRLEPGAVKVPSELFAPINNTGVPPERAAAGKATIDLFLRIVGAMHKAGIVMVVGTDQVVPGHSLRREIELFVKAGLTPMDAIQAATIVPARVMKLDHESGSVEAGKLADLILIDGNPLENISNIRNTRFVVTKGKIYDCARLWESVGFKP